MPVVEPYAISEPSSTAGKINLNFQIVPFTYIERSTALHALFRSERVIAIPNGDGGSYKSSNSKNYRFEIDADKTLEQFRQRFAAQEIFRSASQICEVYLVPKGVPGFTNVEADAMPAFWQAHALTGDNVKERPYGGLYPRLTTKSNTYTVHYQVQSLQQAGRSRGDDPAAWASWDEERDSVTGESRGSTTLERYLDPGDATVPDFALAENAAASLDQHYRFRVLSTKKFSP
jgi:uncharacterized protein (TIGR02600 family)